MAVFEDTASLYCSVYLYRPLSQFAGKSTSFKKSYISVKTHSPQFSILNIPLPLYHAPTCCSETKVPSLSHISTTSEWTLRTIRSMNQSPHSHCFWCMHNIYWKSTHLLFHFCVFTSYFSKFPQIMKYLLTFALLTITFLKWCKTLDLSAFNPWSHRESLWTREALTSLKC